MAFWYQDLVPKNFIFLPATMTMEHQTSNQGRQITGEAHWHGTTCSFVFQARNGLQNNLVLKATSQQLCLIGEGVPHASAEQ